GNTTYSAKSTSTIPAALNAFSFATSTTAVPMLTLDSTNTRVGVGTTSPGATLGVSGSGLFNGKLTINDPDPSFDGALIISVASGTSAQSPHNAIVFKPQDLSHGYGGFGWFVI